VLCEANNTFTLGSTDIRTAFVNVQLNHIVSKKKLYIAPEVYANVMQKRLNEDFDAHKADCFS